jgi:hypothetical protein
MALKDLLPELLKLNHDEKVQAIDILQREVSAENRSEVDTVPYELWSPAITPGTAAILQDMLKQDKEKHD